MALEMKYFVLKPKAKYLEDPFAIASQSAMLQYADLIQETDAQLAEELRTWAREEIIQQARLVGEDNGT